ncbi:MAG: hypothetical protein E7270_06130, partial [Lachnospiraceae bacterium]|nr:hypothetical protein [Lachnospiraceae bacterium]
MKKTSYFKRILAGILCFCMVSQTALSDLTITAFASNSQNVEAGDNTEEGANTPVQSVENEKISLECTDYSTSAVNLKWSVEEITDEYASFSILRDGVSIGSVEASDATEYTFSDTNVSLNANYTYEVQALDSEGNPVAASENVLVEILEDWVISGDTTLSANKKVKSLTITKGELNLGSYELVVTGDVNVHGSGSSYIARINTNKGYLSCNNISFNNYSGLIMQDVNGYVLVNGNFSFTSRYNYTINAGTIEIKGDFNLNTSSTNVFCCSGTHKAIFSGNKKQTINFNNNNTVYFNTVEINNKSEEGIYCNGAINAYDLNTNGCNVDFCVENGRCGWTLSENEVINGDLVLIADTLDLNGYELTVTGDIIQVGGKIKVNKGQLNVNGNYYIENKKNTDGTDTFTKSSGLLQMVNAEDYVLVTGNFQMGSMLSSSGYLNNGTLEVKGNVTQKTYGNQSNFLTTGGFKLLLSGDAEQTVSFANTSTSVSRIANFETTNESE